jgi:hypothetical protein
VQEGLEMRAILGFLIAAFIWISNSTVLALFNEGEATIDLMANAAGLPSNVFQKIACKK